MAIVSLILVIVGFVAFAIGLVMILIVAFKDKVTKGLLCLFITPYTIFYLFARYKEANKMIVIILLLGGLGLLIVGQVLAPPMVMTY